MLVIDRRSKLPVQLRCPFTEELFFASAEDGATLSATPLPSAVTTQKIDEAERKRRKCSRALHTLTVESVFAFMEDVRKDILARRLLPDIMDEDLNTVFNEQIRMAFRHPVTVPGTEYRVSFAELRALAADCEAAHMYDAVFAYLSHYLTGALATQENIEKFLQAGPSYKTDSSVTFPDHSSAITAAESSLALLARSWARRLSFIPTAAQQSLRSAVFLAIWRAFPQPLQSLLTKYSGIGASPADRPNYFHVSSDQDQPFLRGAISPQVLFEFAHKLLSLGSSQGVPDPVGFRDIVGTAPAWGFTPAVMAARDSLLGRVDGGTGGWRTVGKSGPDRSPQRQQRQQQQPQPQSPSRSQQSVQPAAPRRIHLTGDAERIQVAGGAWESMEQWRDRTGGRSDQCPYMYLFNSCAPKGKPCAYQADKGHVQKHPQILALLGETASRPSNGGSGGGRGGGSGGKRDDRDGHGGSSGSGGRSSGGRGSGHGGRDPSNGGTRGHSQKPAGGSGGSGKDSGKRESSTPDKGGKGDKSGKRVAFNRMQRASDPASPPDAVNLASMLTDHPVVRGTVDKQFILCVAVNGGFPTEAILDPGATRSFIGRSVLDKIRAVNGLPHIRRRPSDATITYGNGSVGAALGKVRMAVRCTWGELTTGDVHMVEVPVNFLINEGSEIIIGNSEFQRTATTDPHDTVPVSPFLTILHRAQLARNSVRTAAWGVHVPPRVNDDGDVISPAATLSARLRRTVMAEESRLAELLADGEVGEAADLAPPPEPLPPAPAPLASAAPALAAAEPDEEEDSAPALEPLFTVHAAATAAPAPQPVSTGSDDKSGYDSDSSSDSLPALITEPQAPASRSSTSAPPASTRHFGAASRPGAAVHSSVATPAPAIAASSGGVYTPLRPRRADLRRSRCHSLPR